MNAILDQPDVRGGYHALNLIFPIDTNVQVQV